jgi:peptidase E
MKPIHLLSGGPGSDPAALRRLLEAVYRDAGVRGPRVAYVGVANGDDRGFHRRIARFLQDAGARDVPLAPLAGRRADLDEARMVLAQADVVHVAGGDVDEGMRVLRGCGILDMLRERLAAGVPFFGMSAGSIMLGRQWVRWTDPDDDTTVQAFDCMGFAPLICDTHAEDDGWAELAA